MRLYGMYYVCKKYIHEVENMNVENRSANGNTIRYITEWDKKSIVLNDLAKIEPLRKDVRTLYETIPIIYRDQKQFDITGNVANNFLEARNALIIAMDTIIRLYDTLNTNKSDSNAIGFDIKLPQFKDIGEFSQCLQDLNFVINQCPYLREQEGEIKYGAVDVGSTWLTFLIIGVAGTTILKNLGKLVDMAVKIKSHMATVKLQEEMLRSVEIKNEIAAEVLDAFKKTNQRITQNCVDELEGEIGVLENGEEKDKVGRSIEKLGFWMEKGMQIYSAIDAPEEAQNVFPVQEEISFLSDDLLKLIEEKKESK